MAVGSCCARRITSARNRMLAAFTFGLDLNCKDKLNEWISGTIKLQFR
jgi:hypothetical protein